VLKHVADTTLTKISCKMSGDSDHGRLVYTPHGKTVVITGFTQGIGKSTALEFLALGAQVLGCARSQADIDALLEICSTKGFRNRIHGIACDVSTESGRATLVEKAQSVFGSSLDVLINNVGTNLPANKRQTVQMNDADFDMIMDVNLKSAYSLSRDFYPMLLTSGSGCILFNSSVAGGPTAMKSGCLYGMSKAAMNMLVKSLACEWGKDGIRVVGVAPWYTNTELAQRVLSNKDYADAVLARTPMGRVAEPEEVARVFAYLASPAASFITGAIVPVDGGYSAMGLF
jgi:Tropinone reductase 1